MNWMPIIIQLISGGVGGNIAGALLKRFNLGPIGTYHRRDSRRCWWRSPLLGMLTGAAAAAPGCGERARHVFHTVQCRWRMRIGGAVIMVIVGLIKAQMSKSAIA